MPSVSEQFPGVGQSVQKPCCPLVVTHLARRQVKGNRPAFTITSGVKLGVQSAFCPSDTAGKSPFLSRLAAVRWASRRVASIIGRSVSPCFSASSINILLKTPSLLQGFMWPILARCVFPLKSMSYDVNDSTGYPQIVNARNAMGQRKIWLAPIRLGTGKIEESTHGSPPGAL